MNENPRMLVAFCLEKYSISNRANMLANMLARFASAFTKSTFNKTYLFHLEIFQKYYRNQLHVLEQLKESLMKNFIFAQ